MTLQTSSFWGGFATQFYHCSAINSHKTRSLPSQFLSVTIVRTIQGLRVTLGRGLLNEVVEEQELYIMSISR